jgi:hypothetical protein
MISLSLKRLAMLLSDTETTCYAWALIPNHLHLLLCKFGVGYFLYSKKIQQEYNLMILLSPEFEELNGSFML